MQQGSRKYLLYTEYNTGLYSDNIDKRQLKILKDEVDNYKQAYGLVDFTDMIEKFNESKLCPNFTTCLLMKHKTYHLYNGECLIY